MSGNEEVCKRRKFYKRKRNRNDQASTPANCDVFEEDVEAEFLPMNNIKSIVRMCLPEIDPATGKKYQVSQSFYLLLSDIISEFLHLVCCKLYLSLDISSQPATVDRKSVV